jgi:hypothetical protein
VALKAEKIKELKNEGNLDSTLTHVSYDNTSFIPNLENLGISDGNYESSTSQALIELSSAIHACTGVNKIFDKKREVLELEEKELEDEEEVDKLLLQNICGEIMEEVMDVGRDNFVIPTKHITMNRSRKKWGKVAK